MPTSHLARSVFVGAVLVLGPVTSAQAQLLTQHIKGTVGLKAGSQPPPNIYVIAPLIYVYSTDEVKDRNGDRAPIDGDITSAAYGVGVNVVTSRRLFGGLYGFQVLFPVGANNRIQGTEIDFNPGAGLTDSVLSPVSLGWHFPRADVITGYTIFVPTGRFTYLATDNTGFGMWGHELSAGTTVFFNEAKAYHAATIVSFDIQSKKEDSETKVGNAMNLEGGVGADLLRGGMTVGLNYYASFKLTDDEIQNLPGVLIRGRNKQVALGPEVSMALARRGSLYGFVKVNYQWEVYARTATQGTALTIMATFLGRPLKLP